MKTGIIYPPRILNLLVQYKKKCDAFTAYCAESRAMGQVHELDFKMAHETDVQRRIVSNALIDLQEAIKGWTIKYKKKTIGK